MNNVANNLPNIEPTTPSIPNPLANTPAVLNQNLNSQLSQTLNQNANQNSNVLPPNSTATAFAQNNLNLMGQLMGNPTASPNPYSGKFVKQKLFLKNSK